MNRRITRVFALAAMVFLAAWQDAVAADPPDAPTTQPAATQPDLQAGGTGDVKFEQTPLQQALESLRERADVSMVVHWVAMADEGVTPTTPVTLTLTDVTFETALRELLVMAGGGNVLTYRIVQKVVTVSSRADIGGPGGFMRHAQPTRELQELVRRKLADVDFTDVPLEQAVSYLREAGKVNILVDWRSLATVGIAPRTLVSLHLKQVDVISAVDYVLTMAAGREHVLESVREDNMVVITTVEVLNQGRDGLDAPNQQFVRMLVSLPPTDTAAIATELGKQFWALEVEIAGLKARIAACKKELPAELQTNEVFQEVSSIRAKAEIDLADLLVRREIQQTALDITASLAEGQRMEEEAQRQDEQQREKERAAKAAQPPSGN